jgi:hypothetical protein
MSGVATAVAAVGAGAAVYGANKSAKAAKSAAKTQAAAADAGVAEQRRQFDITQANQAPWLAAGQKALGNLTNDPAAAFQSDPGYQYALDQQQRAIQHSAAARGTLGSGNTLKALQQNAIGLADQNYGNWWNRQAGLAGVGQAAANNLAAYGQNNANNVSQLLVGQGDARASGIAGSANAWNAGIGTAVGYGADAFNNWWNNRQLQPVKVTAQKIGGI